MLSNEFVCHLNANQQPCNLMYNKFQERNNVLYVLVNYPPVTKIYSKDLQAAVFIVVRQQNLKVLLMCMICYLV
jgi:hypothetical protein